MGVAAGCSLVVSTRSERWSAPLVAARAVRRTWVTCAGAEAVGGGAAQVRALAWRAGGAAEVEVGRSGS